MEYTRWDDYLVSEHEMIERAMAVLKDCLADIDASAAKPTRMIRAMDFLLEFGDKIHNKKEEDHLFPMMAERGIPIQNGPLGVMLMEHRMERELLSSMIAEAKSLAAASAITRGEYRERGEQYLKIRAEHIWKENDILYAMGRRVLAEEDNAKLLASFAAIDRAVYGPDARSKFEQMLSEAEKGGAAQRKLIENLSYAQLNGIMEAMPFEVTFVDAEDTVAYFNRLDREKLFPRTRSVVGRKVQKCHPEKSVDTVEKIVAGFRDKTRDKAEFWIDFKGDKILIRYFPVYGDDGGYLGVLEVTQAIGEIQKITGQKRLLD